MKIQLNQIAHIRVGKTRRPNAAETFRAQRNRIAHPDSHNSYSNVLKYDTFDSSQIQGDTLFIQMGDLKNSSFLFDGISVQRTLFDDENFAALRLRLKPEDFVQPGDIIFKSRGLKTSAVVISKNIGKAVLVSPLFRIRVKDKSLVLPEYLCWYINQPAAQGFLQKRRVGTSLQMVSLTHLMELEVPVPPLEKQKAIVEIHSIQLQEKFLRKQLDSKREKHIQKLLAQTIQNGEDSKNQASRSIRKQK